MSRLTSSAVESALSSAEDICRARGSRLTTKRRQVLAGLLDSDKALSAYELTDYCREQLGYQLPAMSVYRILDFLEQQLLVHRLSTSNKYVSCAHITCDHKHFQTTHFLLCEGCSSVEEVDATEEASEALEQMAKTVGFKLNTQQFELSGICTTCQNSASGGL